MFGPIDAVIFDFDGTLVDSMSSVVKGLQEAVALGTGKTVPVEDLVKTFGAAPFAILQKWVPEDRVADAYQHWVNFEASLGPADMRVFDGVPEMLELVVSRGMPIGVFTGRDRAGAIRIMRHHGWFGKYFTEKNIMCGDDGFAPKPHPDALAELVRRLSLDPKRTLMVGDHPYDAMAGRAVGTKTAAALWDLPHGGKTQRARFREAWKKWDGVPCDLRLESPLSLREWILRDA